MSQRAIVKAHTLAFQILQWLPPIPQGRPKPWPWAQGPVISPVMLSPVLPLLRPLGLFALLSASQARCLQGAFPGVCLCQHCSSLRSAQGWPAHLLTVCSDNTSGRPFLTTLCWARTGYPGQPCLWASSPGELPGFQTSRTKSILKIHTLKSCPSFCASGAGSHLGPVGASWLLPLPSGPFSPFLPFSLNTCAPLFLVKHHFLLAHICLGTSPSLFVYRISPHVLHRRAWFPVCRVVHRRFPPQPLFTARGLRRHVFSPLCLAYPALPPFPFSGSPVSVLISFRILGVSEDFAHHMGDLFASFV